MLRPGPRSSGLSGPPLPVLPTVARFAPAPSREALRLIVAGTGYLLVIAGLQLAVTLHGIWQGTDALTGHLMDVRDVVALFGWVGLMISGVGVIIVPNHLKVPLRPGFLPRLHFVLANVGLASFFAVTLIAPESAFQDACLAVVSLSYLLFGIGVAATVLPFLAQREPGRPSPPASDEAPPLPRTISP